MVRSLPERRQGIGEAMIRSSDNEAALAIDLMVGDREGLQAFVDALGLSGFQPGSA